LQQKKIITNKNKIWNDLFFICTKEEEKNV